MKPWFAARTSPSMSINRDNMGKKGVADDNQIIQLVHNQLGGPGSRMPTSVLPQRHSSSRGSISSATMTSSRHLLWMQPAERLSLTPTSRGSFVFVFPGGQPVVSSNGTSNGIVWAVDQSPASSLHAFDATDVSRELFRSPPIGQAAKWAVPTVINGKVFVATKSSLVVFGLK